MKTIQTLYAIALAGLLGASVQAADSFVVDKAHAEVGFQVTHLGLSKVKGWFKDFNGVIQVDPAKPEASSVEFTIQVASIDTNNATRDKDLREGEGLFEAAKYPTITFKSMKVAPKAKGQFDVTGTLVMHGVSKQVTLPVTAIGPITDPWGNQKYGFETEITLNRKDYGIVWHQVMDGGGLVMGEEVKISINFEAQKKKEAAAK